MDINDNLIKISRSIKGIHNINIYIYIYKDVQKSDNDFNRFVLSSNLEWAGEIIYSNPIRGKPEADVLSLKLK